jgi:hypothetical protein
MLALRSLRNGLSEELPPSLVLYEQTGECACGASLPLPVRLGLRSKSRPVFERRWSCSTRCLEQHIANAIRRESPRGPSRSHRHRVPLGLVLLSTGAVTRADLRRALTKQLHSQERIGDVLRRECGLTDMQVAEALALQWGCGVETAASAHIESMASIAPAALFQQAAMLPVRLNRTDGIHVAFAHSVDTQAVFALQRVHGLPVRPGIAPVAEWQQGYERLMHADRVTAHIEDCADLAEIQREVVRSVRQLQPIESRWVRAHDLYWLRMWLEPAAFAGGPTQREDVVDFVYRVMKPTLPPLS